MNCHPKSHTMRLKQKRFLFAFLLLIISSQVFSQFYDGVKWSKDGNSYSDVKDGNIIMVSLPGNKETIIVPKEKLVPAGRTDTLAIRAYFFSDDNQKILIYTNSKKVWRYDTRGDYWIYNIQTASLV